MAASVGVFGNGRVTSPPGIDCRQNSVLGCTLPFAGVVTLTATPDTGNIFMGWSGACSGKSPTCQIVPNNQSSILVTATFKLHKYLLLHGMNSDATIAWNDLVKAKFGGSCTEMIGSTFCINSQCITPPANQQCFRINFKTNQGWPKGDGSTFNELGTEVGNAVTEISKSFPNSVITLVGHSRGGLAARAFLQGSSSSRSKVVGLLTIGTPHQGSPLGRMYTWLKNHPRPTQNCKENGKPVLCATNGPPSDNEIFWDWSLADRIGLSGLDVRSPTIKFLATDSGEISTLNQGVSRLDRNIQYAQIVSNGVNFGFLMRGGRYTNDIDIWPSLSISARNHITQKPLTTPNPTRDSNGDGIVPINSQRMNQLFGSPGSRETVLTGVLHTEETGRTTEIINALNSIAR